MTARLPGFIVGFMVGYWFDKGFLRRENHHQAERNFYKKSQEYSPPNQPLSPNERLEKAYQTLNISPQVDDKELTRVYRKSMSRYHPDRWMNQQLSAKERQYASEKAQAINAAYELIQKARKKTP